MNHGDQKYPGFQMNQPMKTSQYQQQISRLQNPGTMQGMPNMNQFQQQILQQQQLKAYQMAMSNQQMMGAPGQFPFQHPGMMKQQHNNMMQHQQQANMQSLQAQMGQINQQMQNQFMQQRQQMQNQKAQQAQNANQMEMVQNQVNQGLSHMQNQVQPQQQQQPGSTNPSAANTTAQTPNIDAQALNKSTSNSSFNHGQDANQPMTPNTNQMMPQGQQHSGMPTQQQMMQNANFQMQYGNQQYPMNFPLQGAPLSATASTAQLNIQQQQNQQVSPPNPMQQQQNHQQAASNQVQQQFAQNMFTHQAQLQKQLKNKKQSKNQAKGLSKQQAHAMGQAGASAASANAPQNQQQVPQQQQQQQNPMSPVPQTPQTPAMQTPQQPQTSQAPPPQPPQQQQTQQITQPPNAPSQQQQTQQPTAPPQSASSSSIASQSQTHTKKNKAQQLQKRRTKKHAAPTENPEPTLSETIPESPSQPPLQMSQDEIQLITKAIQSMGEDKYESYFRVFGCTFKRKENTIENFLTYFSNHVYRTLPTPVKFATDLAEQYKLQTNVYMLLMNPPCPLVLSPLKTYKIQYQLTHCCPKGAEFNLLTPAKRGDAIAYGVFISLFEMVPPVPINVDKEDVSPCNFGDQSSYYPIQLSNKTKITIKFPPSIGTQIKWFVLMYATKKPPVEVLHTLMDRANIPRNETDKIIAQTPQCHGCSFDPIPVIEQASNGIATCPLCGKNVVLSELILIKKQCMKNLLNQSCGPTPAIPQSGSLQQIGAQKAQQAPPQPEEIPENPEEEKLISILADQIAVCVRPKPESSGWTKAIDVEPIESKLAEKPFYATSFDEFMKGMDEIDDDFF